MDNWRMGLANLGQVVRKKSVERREWCKKGKEVSNIRKSLQRRTKNITCIFDQPKRIFEVATKENLQT